MLVDTLLAVGPDEPTLSEGLDDAPPRRSPQDPRGATRSSAIKAAGPKIGDDVVEELVGQGYDDLVEQFHAGPPPLSIFGSRQRPSTQRARALHPPRGRPARRSPRGRAGSCPTGRRPALGASCGRFTKGIVRHAPVPVTLRRSDAPDESLASQGPATRWSSPACPPSSRSTCTAGSRSPTALRATPTRSSGSAAGFRLNAPGGPPRRAPLDTSHGERRPKWNTLAASTASAPASTAGGKCSAAPGTTARDHRDGDDRADRLRSAPGRNRPGCRRRPSR